MPRVCFIVNPAAGHGRAKKNWEKVKPLVDSFGGDHTVRFTERPMHAAELAGRAAEEGCERVVVFGGDGTLNEAGNGLVGTGVALALVPTGSANDWVRQFSIPMAIDEAVRLALNGRRASIDVGLVESQHGRRYFFNMIGAGFDAEAADKVNRLGPLLKAVPGTLPTVVCVILTLFTYRYPTITLRIDGEERDIPKAVLSAFGICGYVGGGMMILPGAVPDDGLFDVLWAHGISRPGILGLLTKIYKGKHVDHPGIEMTRARRVEVSSSLPLIWHMDGEIGGRLPISVEVVPKALDVILP
jgi:YegS/Rv2252/BmrU family lipid kinase